MAANLFVTPIVLTLLFGFATSLGPLPDASQEGLLWQWKNYASIALFHYNVPQEATRATWEFASFQDSPDCPSRKVHVWIQQGSYPLINASSSDEFPTLQYYTERTSLEWVQLVSSYKPSDSVVHPVYNPLPGSWFVAAYLEPEDEPIGFLQKKCRYSLGSIALWTKTDNVELILPNSEERQIFRTRRHFSYYKFYVPSDISRFIVTVFNCKVKLKHERPKLSSESCIDYVGLRARALPLHNPIDHEQQGLKNVSATANATFTEERPYEGAYYYLLVVTHGQVEFEVDLRLIGCGESGLYGPGQRDWYLNERGLIWDGDPGSNNSSERQPKEPQAGFQLFSTRQKTQRNADGDNKLSAVENVDDDSAFNVESLEAFVSNNTVSPSCISKFDFTRVENVRPFNVIYMLQGRIWYTKWLTVLERTPIFTRFSTLEFIDLGGSLNIRISMDHFSSQMARKQNSDYYQVVFACVSFGRQPRVQDGKKVMICDNHAATLRVANLDTVIGADALKVIPYPEPGTWYVGFQMRCIKTMTGKEVECPEALESTMVSVDVNIQPCDHRPLREVCGGLGKGVCASHHKGGSFTFSSCSCSPGYTGFTCDKEVLELSQASTRNTLLLTLTNLCFLPAIVLSWMKGLYGQFIVYLATMSSSIFYHACDQESFTGHLPRGFQTMCLELYVNQEVLQFCDFFCAILSFWVTISSLARLPESLVNAMNLFGSLLIAFLVQYNRTGYLVLIIPVPLGLAVFLISVVYRSVRQKRLLLPGRRGCLFYLPAMLCVLTACLLATVLGTTKNYAFVHSGWHALIALSLAFLVARCKKPISKKAEQASSSEDTGQTAFEDEQAMSVSNITISTHVGSNPSVVSIGAASSSPRAEAEPMASPESDPAAAEKRGRQLPGLSYIQKFSALVAKERADLS